METKTLDFSETLRDSLCIGIKNAPSIIAAVVLYLVTIWIPYINIGTTIAITLLPTQLAKGEVINPASIFDSKYRRYMGEYLITTGLMILPILIAFAFLYIPGIVLSLAWSLSYYFLIEKGKNPMEAIKASNDATYGSKWTMFFVIRRHLRHPRRGMQPDRRGVHHLPGHVRARRAGHLYRHGHRSLDLETAEGQRGVEIPSHATARRP